MSSKIIVDNTGNEDGIDRRGFLKCMAWVGTGVLWTMHSGILSSRTLNAVVAGQIGKGDSDPGDFGFVQISDSHIGFAKEANPNVVGTLQTAIARINALAAPPSFILHTGDLSHLSKDSEFDTLDQNLRTLKSDRIFYVPGEHDVLVDNGKSYLARYGKETKGDGWYSFDYRGVHFVGLVNVLNLKPGGLGLLGEKQLDWLADDLKRFTDSTPIVVFAHVPLWSVYPQWGWGTDDAARALSYLKRFGSVTVLNGHIHQVLQKVEGNVTFHTAMSTAFPQPAPGSAPSPGPMKVPADRLASLLGITGVNYVVNSHSLAIIDSPLASVASGNDQTGEDKKDRKSAGRSNEVSIDNFSFTPETLTVVTGTTVTWTNHDDVPHIVVSTDKKFKSPVLDTDQKYSFKFIEAGSYDYYCSVHPKMTGRVVVH